MMWPWRSAAARASCWVRWQTLWQARCLRRGTGRLGGQVVDAEHDELAESHVPHGGAQRVDAAEPVAVAAADAAQLDVLGAAGCAAQRVLCCLGGHSPANSCTSS